MPVVSAAHGIEYAFPLMNTARSACLVYCFCSDGENAQGGTAAIDLQSSSGPTWSCGRPIKSGACLAGAATHHFPLALVGCPSRFTFTLVFFVKLFTTF